MKSICVFLGVLLVSIMGFAKEYEALVVAENGLNMRSEPYLTAPKIGKIRYQERVLVLVDKEKRPEKHFSQEYYYEDTKEREFGEEVHGYSPQIGERYGRWQKIKWNEKEGWVFSAWLRLVNTPSSVELLSEIPLEYFSLGNDDSSSKITYDCFGGNGNLWIEPLGTYHYNYPVIWADYGQDGDGFRIYEVQKVGDTYQVKAKSPMNKNEMVFINFQKQPNGTFIVSNVFSTNVFIPVEVFEGSFYVTCEKEP